MAKKFSTPGDERSQLKEEYILESNFHLQVDFKGLVSIKRD